MNTPAITEREITAPVSLTRDRGRLNPDAVGWTRAPLHDTDGIGTGLRLLGRNKRWEYWAVTTPTHVVALTISDIDYAAVNGIWVLDRERGTEISLDAIGPFGRGSTLPGTLAAGPARATSKAFRIAVDEVAGGTRLRAEAARVSIDVVAALPTGHERLGVVVPWTDRLFQYTVKDVARPATGRITVDGVDVPVPPGDAWATLDHGRGRWPYRVHWNWGAGSGRVDGRVVGIQVGGKWTDGTGSVENSLLVGTRLHKISEELVWDYDPTRWEKPWLVHGERVDLTFTPEYVKEVSTNLVAISSATHQAFGTWSGRVQDESGAWVRVADVFGWAEDVRQRW
ncbi:DUF2804 domain-containing protein [Cellulomonas sp.]|uniref:DUF2804 domain-containing protein n=1 Tax=Cellulomonas sp. TaxID=40001 RepID=UPI001B15A6CA|nr:DUF2804 domain-containing protein [Cellulomonas sp.]MBO9556206.1 DUF2804 domain-containing protein [Cellulomonas sp.]